MNLTDRTSSLGFTAFNVSNAVDTIYPVNNVIVITTDTRSQFANYSIGNVPVLICNTDKEWSVNSDVSKIRFWANNETVVYEMEGTTVETHDSTHSDLCGVFLDVNAKKFHIGRLSNMTSVVKPGFYFFGGITAVNGYTKLSDCILPIAYRNRMINKGGVLEMEYSTEGNGIVFEGDSITYGTMDSLNGNPRAAVTFPRFAAAKLGYTFTESVDNRGVNGCTISKYSNRTNSIVERCENVDYGNYKIAIIGGGTNDWSYGQLLGDSYDSTDITTVYGALNHILSKMYIDNKYIRVFAWTPMMRWLRSGTYMDPKTLKVNDKTIIEFAKCIENYYKYKGIPVINMIENGFITELNKPNTNICADGLHPGQVGYEMLANKITNFVKANMY